MQHGREASSAGRGAIAWGGQGRWGSGAGCVSQASLPPAGHQSGRGRNGGQVCGGGTQEGGHPASLALDGPGLGRGVDGSAPPAPLRGVPSCFRGWHQASVPVPHAPTCQAPPWLRAKASPCLSLHGCVMSINCVPRAQDTWAEDTGVGDQPRTGSETEARQARAPPPHQWGPAALS